MNNNAANLHTGHLLRRTQQLHHALWNREVSIEVSSVQFAVLSVLQHNPGISQSHLGDELDLDRSTIADLVSRMTRRKLIARTQSPADGRRKALTLTEKGVTTLHVLRPRVDHVETLLLEGITQESGHELRETLLKMLTHGVKQGMLRNTATPTRLREPKE